MLCSKEEELNRTKATMNAIREERDRLRRRVSAPRPRAGPARCGPEKPHAEPRAALGVLWPWELPSLSGYELIVSKPLLKGK